MFGLGSRRHNKAKVKVSSEFVEAVSDLRNTTTNLLNTLDGNRTLQKGNKDLLERALTDHVGRKPSV